MRRTPSTPVSNAAYMRAMALAETFPPAGMSALSTSVRLPIAALGNADIGAALNIGKSGGISGIGPVIGASSRRASRWCSDSGMPK